MNNLLKEEAVRHGDRLQIVRVERLKDLENEIARFKGKEELNGFQQWIINNLYKYHLPQTDFEVKSIIIVAAHHPFSAEVKFTYEGKTYTTRSLVHSDVSSTKKYLEDVLSSLGYHMQEVWDLPLKRLAVQSGLSVYGRNNITYVPDLGSSFSYMTFLTDATSEKDEWREVCHADICDQCNICMKACPTGAIRKDRFLIDNERCLPTMNESGGEFPEWLPDDVHHTLYDCLRCQERCPLNKEVSKDKLEPVYFCEEETAMLLEGKGPEDFSEEFRKNADKIGLFDWRDGLPRNMKAIMKLEESQI